MAIGARALPLVCKMTRFLPGDVTRLVRECLRVHVGERCPEWIDDLLWQQLPRLVGNPRPRNFVTWMSRNIDPAIYPQELTFFDESSSDEEEMDDEGVRVTVMLEACGLGCPQECTIANGIWGYRWTIRCRRGDTQLRNKVGYHCNESLTKVLEELRGHFDCRRAGPSATMDVPSSLQEWRSFISLWLFGPPAPKQATLAKWLRRRPASLPLSPGASSDAAIGK